MPRNNLKSIALWICFIIPAIIASFPAYAFSATDDIEDLPITNPPFPIRGIYINAWAGADAKRFFSLIEMIKKTNLNAVVLDLKETDGVVVYDSELNLIKKLGAAKKILNLKKIISTLKENNIYPIARICVFKDQHLAKVKPNLAVQDKRGGVWKDRKGHAWVDPYSRRVWYYNLAIAQEAAQAGFLEIQFDYVRFPSDGEVEHCFYPHKDGQKPAEVIGNFLSYVKTRLEPFDVLVSVDIFGLTGRATHDLGIGQVLEKIVAVVDYVCPMVYPSHYAPGEYGFANPETAPYQIVSLSLKDFLKGAPATKIRPWLQDFSLRKHYSAKEVSLQIKAVEDLGLKEWLLWNPSSRYTWNALKK